MNVVRPDGEEHEIEVALGTLAPRKRQCVAKLDELSRDGLRAGAAPSADDLACALRVEKALGDLRAGAGERQERHGDMWGLHGQRGRRAHLVAVERTVAGGAEPAGGVLRPVLVAARGRIGAAGAVAAVAGAARPVIVGPRRAEKAAEAEALVGEGNLTVGISLA